MKAIAILRVSTDSQRIDEQKEELIAFLKGQGYDDIIPLEAVGASAIKMDDKYLELVDRVKSAITGDKEIKAAGVWELSRLGRNEVILFQFKEFFIQHRIQFICKQPYMKLLEDDGSVNAGMELAFSLYATMARQEMVEKKARFARTKRAMAASGKYVGGHIIPFGYCVGEDGFYKEKEDEASAIRLAFQLYSTGRYSTYTLSQELEERGVSIQDTKLCRMLRNRAYVGEPVGEFQTRFPAIVSKELFEEVEKVRKGNRIDMKKKGIALGAKLIRCYKCGAVCTSNSRHYVCSRHSHHGNCDNGFALRKSVADSLLWRIASILQIDYLTNLNADKEREYREEISVLQQKADAVAEKISKAEVKRARIVESYMDGLIDKKTRDLRLLKVQDDIRAHLDVKSSLVARMDTIAGLLEGMDKDSDLVEAVADAAILEYTAQEKYAIIQRFIVSLTGKPVSYGERDKRCKKPNGVEIEITTVHGAVHRFMYFPKFFNGHNLYIAVGRRWVPDFID